VTMLNHQELVQCLETEALAERLVVAPMLDKEQIGPASIDLRLGSEFVEVRRREESLLDPYSDAPAQVRKREEQVVVPLGESVVLHPGQFVLGSTFEFIRMPPHLAGQVLSRSSWARQGLIVATAVTVQPGYAGVLTLEIVNMGPIPMALYPGLRIAQLCVWRLGGPTQKPYLAGPFEAPLGPRSRHAGWKPEEREMLEKIAKVLRGDTEP
jgi:dCTP deaminase